jgi:hypothetical protein
MRRFAAAAARPPTGARGAKLAAIGEWLRTARARSSKRSQWGIVAASRFLCHRPGVPARCRRYDAHWFNSLALFSQSRVLVACGWPFVIASMFVVGRRVVRPVLSTRAP